MSTEELLDDEPWSLIPRRHYYHRCCFCGETHRLSVEVLEAKNGQQRVILRLRREPRRTAAYRRAHPELAARIRKRRT